MDIQVSQQKQAEAQAKQKEQEAKHQTILAEAEAKRQQKDEREKDRLIKIDCQQLTTIIAKTLQKRVAAMTYTAQVALDAHLKQLIKEKDLVRVLVD